MEFTQMDLIPTRQDDAREKPRSGPEIAKAPSPVAPEGFGSSWRWMVIHFPCLEAVTPRGRIVVVSARRPTPEARAENPGLVLWHVRELGMFGGLMDSHGLDLDTFAAVNRLKLRTRGWFMGIDEAKDAEPVVSEGAPMGSGAGRFQDGR